MLSVIATGCAIFSMFFGSGNLIFPIELGQLTGQHMLYGYAGLFITGVFFTLVGLLSLVVYRGNYHTFFNRLGKLPGSVLNVCIIVMIGPLTGIPRAVNVLYQITNKYMADVTLFNFALLFLGILFVMCYKRERVMPLLGYVISPMLIIMLLVLVGYAWLYGAPVCSFGYTPYTSFNRGIFEGYATMDMMAAFHFAPLAITFLQRMSHHPRLGPKRVLRAAITASGITCVLLAIIYLGLTYIGSQFCMMVNTRNPVTLAYMVTQSLLPSGMVVGLHFLFMLAIISTAISLTTIFADFVHEDVCAKHISYAQALLITLIMSGCAANGGLHAILRFEKPFLHIFYPPLIVLTLCNLAYKRFKFRPVKVPVALTFAASIIKYIFQ